MPLLLLPGLLNDEELWRDQLADLADIADCRVGDLTQHDTMPALAAALLERMPPRFALAGFSLGGYVGQEILRQAPERVTRLALLDTSMYPDSPERAAQRRSMAKVAHLPGTFNGFSGKLMRSYVAPSRLGDKALLERIQAMTARLGAPVFVRQSQLARLDGQEVLRRYPGPTLVLCGEHDAITPLPIHREMAALIPQARLEVIADCGHLSPLERPREVSAALRRWLVEP